MDAKTNRTLNKVSYTVEAGYKCANCGWQTVVFGEVVPKDCLNCGTDAPKIAWKNKIKTTSEIEILPV